MASCRPEQRELTDDESGGWTDEPLETVHLERRLNERLRIRRQRFAERTGTGEWCTCGACFPADSPTSDSDLTCCQESYNAAELCRTNGDFGRTTPYKCIVEHPSFFHMCLYERTLNNVKHIYQRAGFDVKKSSAHQQLRYTAYHQYTAFVHGHLGYKHRRRIPACVVKAIRTAFPPDEPDEVVGYESASEEDS